MYYTALATLFFLSVHAQAPRTPQPTIPPPSVRAINDLPLIETNPDRCPKDFGVFTLNYCIRFAKVLANTYEYSNVQTLYQASWSAERSCRFHRLRCEVRHPLLGNSFEIEDFDFTGMCTPGKSAVFTFNYRWVLYPGQVLNAQGSVTLPEGVSTRAISLLDATGRVYYSSNFTVTYKESNLGTYLVLFIHEYDVNLAYTQRTFSVQIASTKLVSSCASARESLTAPQSPRNAGENNDNANLNIIIGVVVGVGIVVLGIMVFCGWKMIKNARERRGYDPDFMDRERQRQIEEMRQQPVMGVPIPAAVNSTQRTTVGSTERMPPAALPYPSDSDPPTKATV